MSSFNLNTPRDIQWRRIAVSDDMIDRKFGDKEFPLRWQSSITLFDFEPEEENQDIDGMIVSYLKVSCSITGFQPRGDEVGLHHSDARRNATGDVTGDFLIDPSRWEDARVIQSYKEAIEDYYGCYGALLEVAVVPKGSDEEIAEISNLQFPYFIDFEPKKRELYEVVSETGEMMSRSLNGINVQKGATTSESHEVLDIFQGASGEGKYAGTGGGNSIQGQWGTKDLNQTEFVDMRTTDSSREKRESFSHTTQLTQMYHQLNSYHIGTNRAVFYVLPRPHIVQMTNDDKTEIDRSTFVDGPRLLEGIQDFFLIVMRPKEIKEICVEAYLETAHIFQEKIPDFPPAENFVDEFVVEGSVTVTDEGETKILESVEDAQNNFDSVVDGVAGEVIASHHGIGGLGGAIGGASDYFDDSKTTIFETVSPRKFHPASPELEFDDSRRHLANCAPTGGSENFNKCQINWEKGKTDEITCTGSVLSKKIFIDRTGPWNENKKELGKATIKVTIPQRQKTPVQKSGDKSLFLTGRGVASCLRPPDLSHPGSIDYEDWFKTSELPPNQPTETNPKMSRPQANEMRDRISSMLIKSVNHRNRKPRGKTSFAESDFFARAIVKTLGDSQENSMPAVDVKGLSQKLVDTLKTKAKYILRKNVLDADTDLLMRELAINYDEVLELRRAMLGLVSIKDADNVLPVQAKMVAVPNLLGLKLGEANKLLQKLKFSTNSVAYIDDSAPKNAILSQDPSPSYEIEIGSSINLKVSTGLSVHIPDIEQMQLTDALIALRRAGLRSEPKIVFKNSSDQTCNHRVAKVSPSMREYITPNAQVTLEVYRFEDKGKTGK